MARSHHSPRSIDLASLLEDDGWLRALCRSLAADAAAAEDLAQETWLTVLQGARPRHGSWRAWVGGVVRNLARRERRRDAGRAEREKRVARPAKPASSGHAGDASGADRLLERAELQRRVIEAVTSLDEPYRATVLLRFFEGLSPAEIALRQGVPASTARSRLERGLARLRERLDREAGGDGRTWLAGLAPLLAPRSAPPVGSGAAPPAGSASTAVASKLAPPLLGGLAMTAATKLAATAAVLAVLSVLAWRALPEREAPRPGPSAPEPERAVSALEPVEVAVQESATTAERAPVEAEPAGEPVSSPGASAEQLAPEPAVIAAPLAGRVLDQHGRGLAGVAVDWGRDAGTWRQEGKRFVRDEDPRPLGNGVRSGPDGAFELPPNEEANRLVCCDPELTAVFASLAPRGDARPKLVLVVAPRIRVAGRVVDEAGLPIAGALVELVHPDGFRARFGEVLDFAGGAEPSRLTDAEGLFEFLELPALEGARLRAAKLGRTDAAAPLPAYETLDLTLVLARPEPGASFLAGRVVTPEGSPVAGAFVGAGAGSVTTSDAAGAFVLPLGEERPERVCAVHPGYRMGAVSADRDAAGAPVWPAAVEVVLGPEPLVLEGVVVDAEGEPQSGYVAYVEGATHLGDDEAGDAIFAESVLAGDPSSAWPAFPTDDAGRFRIEGLLDREYGLQVAAVPGNLRFEAGTFRPGGPPIRVVVPADAYLPAVRGRVVSRSGEGVEGVRVALGVDQVDGSGYSTHSGTLATTGADGGFELTRVPGVNAYLTFEGDRILPLWYRQDAEGLAELTGGGREPLEIVVELRCHYRVELAPGDGADRIGVLDERGRPQPSVQFGSGGRITNPTFGLTGGESPVLATGDGARTLVLYRGDEELRRVPIELVPGELTTIRP